MLVKPAPGRTVRDPRTMLLLPAAGRDVNIGDPFWARRIRDGDVTVEAPAAATTSATSSTASTTPSA